MGRGPELAPFFRWMARPVAIAAVAASGAGLLGCSQDVTTLVGNRGCGLDGDEFAALRVRARGDFPPTEASELLFDARSGSATLSELPDEAQAVTVEGLFGEGVEAVGRTARLHEGGVQQVYFAPPDQVCAVPAGVTEREGAALAAAPSGNVILAGGRDPDGRLLDDLVHYEDGLEVVTPLSVSLRRPSVGHTLHALDEDTFVAIGGAGTDRLAFDSVLRIELVDPPAEVFVSDPIAVQGPALTRSGRAHHGAAQGVDGSVLVVGGCSTSNDGECLAGPETVLSDGYRLALVDDELTFEPVPPLTIPRYGHEVVVARDGVAFVVGGRDAEGAPVYTIERWIPGVETWTPFGPDLEPRFELDAQNEGLEQDIIIVGAALLEGGMLVVARSDGAMQWVSEDSTGTLEGWCEADPVLGQNCFEVPPDSALARRRRPIFRLPGERIVADSFLLPVAFLGGTGDEAVNLGEQRPGQSTPALPARVGAAMVGLKDGTVLMAGGRTPDDQTILPFFARLRPALDGPDETIPDVVDFAPGSLVLHDPARIAVVDGTLRLGAEGNEPMSLPEVWAHVRSFRSDRFRLEVELDVPVTDRRPHIVLTRGAISITSIRIDPDAVKLAQRDASLETVRLTCSTSGATFRGGRRLRVDVGPDEIILQLEGVELARCPSPGPGPFAVGIGASGGPVFASGIRVTRR